MTFIEIFCHVIFAISDNLLTCPLLFLLFLKVLSGFMGWHYPYPSGFLHWHWGNHVIAPVPVKQPWRIWVKSTLNQPQQNTQSMKGVSSSWDSVVLFWVLPLMVNSYMALRSMTDTVISRYGIIMWFGVTWYCIRHRNTREKTWENNLRTWIKLGAFSDDVMTWIQFLHYWPFV